MHQMRHVLGMREVLRAMIVVGKKCHPELVEAVQLVLRIKIGDELLTSSIELWRSSKSRSNVQINKVNILSLDQNRNGLRNIVPNPVDLRTQWSSIDMLWISRGKISDVHGACDYS